MRRPERWSTAISGTCRSSATPGLSASSTLETCAAHCSTGRVASSPTHQAEGPLAALLGRGGTGFVVTVVVTDVVADRFTPHDGPASHATVARQRRQQPDAVRDRIGRAGGFQVDRRGPPGQLAASAHPAAIGGRQVEQPRRRVVIDLAGPVGSRLDGYAPPVHYLSPRVADCSDGSSAPS